MANKLAGGEVVLDHGTFKADQPPLAPKRKLKIDRKKTETAQHRHKPKTKRS